MFTFFFQKRKRKNRKKFFQFDLKIKHVNVAYCLESRTRAKREENKSLVFKEGSVSGVTPVHFKLRGFGSEVEFR